MQYPYQDWIQGQQLDCQRQPPLYALCDVMEYRALNCRSLFSSGNKDVGTGRCRLSPEQFKLFSVDIGWIVRLSLSCYDEKVDLLCTVWPTISSNRLKDGLICVDDTVQFQTGELWSKPDWVECLCRIVQVYPSSPTLRASLSYTGYSSSKESKDLLSSIGSLEDKREYHPAAFLGLPVASGVTIRASGKARPYDALVRYH